MELSIGNDAACAKAVNGGDSVEVGAEESLSVLETGEVAVKGSVEVGVGVFLCVAETLG